MKKHFEVTSESGVTEDNRYEVTFETMHGKIIVANYAENEEQAIKICKECIIEMFTNDEYGRIRETIVEKVERGG